MSEFHDRVDYWIKQAEKERARAERAEAAVAAGLALADDIEGEGDRIIAALIRDRLAGVTDHHPRQARDQEAT